MNKLNYMGIIIYNSQPLPVMYFTILSYQPFPPMYLLFTASTHSHPCILLFTAPLIFSHVFYYLMLPLTLSHVFYNFLILYFIVKKVDAFIHIRTEENKENGFLTAWNFSCSWREINMVAVVPLPGTKKLHLVYVNLWTDMGI